MEYACERSKKCGREEVLRGKQEERSEKCYGRGK